MTNPPLSAAPRGATLAFLAIAFLVAAFVCLPAHGAAAQAPPPPSPDAGEVEILGSCLGLNGRIDIHVRNDSTVTNPAEAATIYEVAVGALAPRVAEVEFGDRHRFSITGRRDGVLPIVVTGDGQELLSSSVTVACDEIAAIEPDTAPIDVKAWCFVGNGRFDVTLRNDLAQGKTYEVTVTGLQPRRLAVPANDSTGTSFTGRRDGSYGLNVLELTPSGWVVAFTQQFAVACDPIDSLVPVVRDSLSHDTDAFTQGLVFHEGRLFESTGSPGAGTSIRELDPETGDVLRMRDFLGTFFGEGIAVVGDEIWMLSWKAQQVFVLDLETFQTNDTIPYSGQGWGLCFDGTYLVMSNGSDEITFRDPVTFDAVRSIKVTKAGVPLANLNELECVEGKIWANVWLTDEIVRIDRSTGIVTAVVDATDLGRPRPNSSGGVLNGIAWNPEKRTWLVTGKFWRNLWWVDFESN